jgi:hypothetical protein
MKKLYKSTDSASFVFEDEQTGQLISNPLWNPEMTSHADPKRYGFEVWDTGGGCTAHGQEFDLDGKKVVMLLTDQGSACTTSIAKRWLVRLVLYDESTATSFPVNPVYWEVTR